MPPAQPPLPRLALHLLLALAMLLQAHVALSRHAEGPPREQASGIANALPQGPIPPCHASATPPVDTPTQSDCCDDSPLGRLCQWACAQPLSLAVPVITLTAQPMRLEAPPLALSLSPERPPTRLLRPPIA